MGDVVETAKRLLGGGPKEVKLTNVQSMFEAMLSAGGVVEVPLGVLDGGGQQFAFVSGWDSQGLPDLGLAYCKPRIKSRVQGFIICGKSSSLWTDYCLRTTFHCKR